MVLKDKLLGCKKGSTIVLLPFILVVLVGICALVTDVGMLYVEKTQLQTAVDAAALAGGQELPANPDSATVITVAKNYAAANGKVGDIVEVTPPTGTNNNYSFTVSARRHAPLYFARIFGNGNTSDVTAIASVVVNTVSGASGIVPFGIVKDAFKYGDLITLKEGGGNGNSGNYKALALDGTGASEYENNIKYGCESFLNYEQWVSTETGNMVGPTRDGISYLINQDPTATLSTVQDGSPRIVTVPLINTLDVNGRGEVQIVGFAVFFIESFQGGEVKGYFMKEVVADSVGGSAPNYGAYHIKLTQ